jgi:hypothetical protein
MVQDRARPDLRPTSISSGSSNFACFWGTLFAVLVDFGRFWSIFGQLDPSSDPILRVSSLFHFSNAGRGASGTLVVLNTVRAIQVRQAHDASWSLGLLRQAATPEVVLVDFRPLFWPNLLRFSPVQPNPPLNPILHSGSFSLPYHVSNPILHTGARYPRKVKIGIIRDARHLKLRFPPEYRHPGHAGRSQTSSG